MVGISAAQTLQQIEIGSGEFDANNFRIGKEFAELRQADVHAGEERNGVNNHAVINRGDDVEIILFDFLEREFVIKRGDGRNGLIAQTGGVLSQFNGFVKVGAADLRDECAFIPRFVFDDSEDFFFAGGIEHEILAGRAADVQAVHLHFVQIVAHDLAQPFFVDFAFCGKRYQQRGNQTFDIVMCRRHGFSPVMVWSLARIAR